MEKQIMYLNHVQLIGFLGKDPEKRQVRGNGANFTVLSVATQQSWKDSNDEWQARTEWHRVVAFNRLGESIADTLHKGDHVLVDGQVGSLRGANSECGRAGDVPSALKVSKVLSAVLGMSKIASGWVVYERQNGEFIRLSKPFKTKELAEKERAKFEKRYPRAAIGVGFVRS
jgi:hypothetical protein